MSKKSSGEIITAINDSTIESQQDLMIYQETKASIGDTAQISIIRNGSELNIPATSTAQPSSN